MNGFLSYKKIIRQDLQDFFVSFYNEWILILFFPGFPEENLELQSPPANTNLGYQKVFTI